MMTNAVSLLSALVMLLSIPSAALAVPMPVALVHSSYTYDSKVTSSPTMDVYHTWNTVPQLGVTGVYSGMMLYFQSGGTGYFGTQIDGDGTRKVIFSMWDASSTVISVQPAMSPCVRFGHEGSGVSCIQRYQWIEGREYKFHVQSAGQTATTVNWTATVTDTVSNSAFTIGTITVTNQGTFQGYGQLRPSTQNFLEHFGYVAADVPCESLPYAKVTWRGPFVTDGTVAPKTTVTNFDNAYTCPSNPSNATYQSGNRVVFESGGTTVRTAANHVNIQNDSGVTPVTPVVADQFAINPTNTAWMTCVFNWGATNYSQLFPTVGSLTSYSAPYYYRRHATGNYLGISTSDKKLYFLGPDGHLLELGDALNWRATTSC